MFQPVVSVVIPCFNAARWVGDAIESAVRQTYPNVEIVVLDDGSTDTSLSVIQSFGARVRWESGPNRGAAAARNRGLQLSRGELLQFLDADDVLYPNKIEQQISCFREHRSDLVFCDCMEKTIGHEQGAVVSRPFGNGDDTVVYVLSGTLPTPAPIHRKEVLLRAGGFREDLPCSQEFDLHLRLAAQGCPFRHLPVPLFEVRKREGSLSSSHEFVLDQYEKIIGPVIGELRERGALTEDRRVALARLMATAGRFYVRFGASAKATRAFDMARQIHPTGWETVYSRPARVLRRIVGPFILEELVSIKRSIARRT